ncbi:hypothetical protein [Pseudoalteromonas sp. MMG022]|uniref:hypothetical protein n=1 Tax=Pseudoalteromonas sp. MMG022 TaxID=2909978 RepID=UPI001F15D19C|nr:hypothetical protein [Pseudoalteromonas sp. MMG022]MCF6436396.1 hypothetical protein [Pseudoalteromonas sp. MMG022]
MIRAISNKHAGLCVAFLLVNTCGTASALASSGNCPTKFQVRHFQPQICYSEYDLSSCSDVCAAATPTTQPACFKELSLPCDVVADMRQTAEGYQQEGGQTWFHVTDLLSYTPLHTQLNVFQASLHYELYQDYINSPGNFGFTPASDELRKQNFRLDLLGRLERESTALRYAAVYRRYSLGVELEDRLNETFAQMMSDIDQFSHFNAAEKQDLKDELSNNLSSQVRLWELLKRYSLETIANSRVRHLNRRMTTYVSLVQNLPTDLQDIMINKSAVLDEYINTAVARCAQGVCFNEITAPQGTPFYPNFDHRLSYFEQSLVALANEASALSYVYDGDYQLVPPQQLRFPDLAGFVSNKLSDYRAERTDVNLERLATAINVAYLAKNSSGQQTLANLSQVADVVNNQGLVTLETLAGKPILLCKEFNKISPEMTRIQNESFALAIEANRLLDIMLNLDYSEELMLQIEEIILKLETLAMRSQAIANVRQFDEDRILTINWQLFDLPEMNSDELLIEVEYFDYNGMFWLPRMSSNLSELFPSIDGLSTSTNSLLPNAVGINSPLNNLQLKIRQSAFHGCSENNQQINMVVKITDEQGIVSRQVLTATLEQI